MAQRMTTKAMDDRIQVELDKIQEIINSRYITRSELMEIINFPKDSPNLIVIKSNEKGIGFLKTCFHSEYWAGIISKHEFDTVVEKASNLIGKTYSKKRQMDSQGVSIFYKLFLFLAAIIAFIFLVMAYYLPEKETGYQIITFILLAISLVIVCLVSLINFCQKTDKIQTFDEMVMTKVGAYFDTLNQHEYNDRGLEWFLVPGHYWLELRIHKQRNNFITEEDDRQRMATNLETDNRLMTNSNSKQNGKHEEIKNSDQSPKEVSKEGRLSEFLKDSDDE